MRPHDRPCAGSPAGGGTVAVAHSLAQARRPVVAMIDVDLFKRINDGHDAAVAALYRAKSAGRDRVEFG